MLCYCSVESFGVGDIEGDRLCKLNALRELLCTVESSAGWRVSVKGVRSVPLKWPTNSDLNASVAQNIQGRPRNEPRAAGILSVWVLVFA